MNCASSLPYTGGPAAVVLVTGLLCLIVGWMLVRHRRPRARHGAATLVLLVIAAGFVVAQPSPGRAADACGLGQNQGGGGNDSGGSGGGSDDGGGSGGADGDMSGDVVITQTSTLAGMTPSSPPALITGTVENTSLDSTYITHVTVRITSVAKTAASPAGACTPADYVLANTRMSVEQDLPERSSVQFSGATLGFSPGRHNQDGCKHAMVHLGYVSGSR